MEEATLKYLQWLPYGGIAMMLVVVIGLYGRTLPTYVYAAELHPIKSTDVTVTDEGYLSFVGYVTNVGNGSCRFILTTINVSWNYTGTVVPVNGTVPITFIVVSPEEVYSINVEAVKP